MRVTVSGNGSTPYSVIPRRICGIMTPIMPSSPWLPPRYRLEERLGAGGMGEVWLAHDLQEDRRIAVKRLLLAGVHDAGELAAGRLRFKREYLTLAKLRVEGIVRAFDWGESADELYYTMEFVAGEQLREHLQAGRYLSAPAPRPDFHATPEGLRRVFALAEALLEILAHLHAEALVHRDLKPANLLVGVEGRLRVIDFGLARETGDDFSITRAGEVLGSPSYLSPEQIRSQALDGRCDLYATGVILYELTTGRLPFTGAGIAEVLIAHLQQPPQPPRELNPRLSPAHNAFILRLLAKEPAGRFPSARAAAQALRAVADEFSAGGFSAPAAGGTDLTRSLDEPTLALPAPAGLLAAPYIANDSARDELLNAGRALLGGEGGLRLVSGPAGAGKSRLGEEMRVFCRDSGVRFFAGGARAEGGMAGQIFQDLFARMAEHVLARPALAAEWLGADGPRLAREFPPLRRLPGLENAAEGGERDPASLRAAVYGFFQRAAQSPLALWLEDLHWADPLSLELLAHLAANFTTGAASGQPQLLMLATSREEGLAAGAPAGRWFAAFRQGREIPLAPLDTAQIGALVQALLGLAAPPPEAFNRRLHELTAGNPFLATETLRNLCAEGKLQQGAGDAWNSDRWFTALHAGGGDSLTGAALSGAVREAVGRQIALLSADDRERLAIAALTGPRFQFSWWQAAAGVSEDELLDSADRAIKAGQLVECGRDALQFRHELLRAALVGELSGLRKRRLHGRILAAIAAEGRETEHCELLAHHAIEAGDAEAAARYGHLAGQRLGELGLAHNVVTLLDRVAALFPPENPMPPAVRLAHDGLLCSMHSFVGECRQAVALARGVVALARELSDTKAEQNGWLRAASALRSLGEIAEMKAAAHAALALAEARGDRIAASQAQRWLGEALTNAGDFSGAREWLEKSAAGALAVGDELRYGTVLGALGVLHFQTGDIARAVEKFEEARAVCERCGNQAGLAVYAGNLGELNLCLGRLPAAEAMLLEAADRNRAIGQALALQDNRNNLGALLLLRGEFARADEILGEALTVVTREGLTEIEADTRFHLGRLRLAQGEPAAAADEVARMAEIAALTGQQPIAARAESLRAEVCMALGDAESALRSAEAALALCGVDASSARIRALALHAAAQAAMGGGAGRESMDEAAALAEKSQNRVLQLFVQLQHARALGFAGHAAEARAAALALAAEAGALGCVHPAHEAAALAAQEQQ